MPLRSDANEVWHGDEAMWIGGDDAVDLMSRVTLTLLWLPAGSSKSSSAAESMCHSSWPSVTLCDGGDEAMIGEAGCGCCAMEWRTEPSDPRRVSDLASATMFGRTEAILKSPGRYGTELPDARLETTLRLGRVRIQINTSKKIRTDIGPTHRTAYIQMSHTGVPGLV